MTAHAYRAPWPNAPVSLCGCGEPACAGKLRQFANRMNSMTSAQVLDAVRDQPPEVRAFAEWFEGAAVKGGGR